MCYEHLFDIILLGTFNKLGATFIILMIGGDAYEKERFFNLILNYNHPFTYSITFCNTKIKDAPNSAMI